MKFSWTELGCLLLALLLPNAVGFLGSATLTAAVTSPWYNNLKKSPLNPPNWVFPVAWTILYTMMGLASFLVFRAGGGFKNNVEKLPLMASRQMKGWKIPIFMYIFQLVVNGIWNPLFFAAERPDLALADIFTLDTLVLLTTWKFFEVSRVAAYMLVPYIFWIAFATYLNFYIWYFN